jgi:hypothetical protein
VAEKLDALLVGVLGCLSPEGANEPSGAGAEQSRVVEDELFGPVEVGVGRNAVPVDALGGAGKLPVSAG